MIGPLTPTGTIGTAAYTVPVAGAATNLFVQISTAASSDSFTFALYVNGSASALTCSVAAATNVAMT